MLVGQQTGSEYHLVVTAQSLLDAVFVNPLDGQIVYLTRTIQSFTTLYRLDESTGSFSQLFTIDWSEEDKGGNPLVTDFAAWDETSPRHYHASRTKRSWDKFRLSHSSAIYIVRNPFRSSVTVHHRSHSIFSSLFRCRAAPRITLDLHLPTSPSYTSGSLASVSGDDHFLLTVLLVITKPLEWKCLRAQSTTSVLDMERLCALQKFLMKRFDRKRE
ncbi:hypothetical protein BS47DRAFT_1399175 [Hydnum rufescens UP504]|uniref:Uncharacterized protein n=1 Tax=Hydnum rufescens UP504 TaxID=1448309 RepID=A0A9P6AJ78_9AGAM|nr:hypothetical protein BS47DRAFT_1399175 [Hydnum rufescens UP504]